MILRSTKSEQFPTRIDILFQNVKAIQLSTILEGLIVRSATKEMEERIIQETGILPDNYTNFFEIEFSKRRGFVVASIVAEDEDEGEFFEPSKYWSDE